MDNSILQTVFDIGQKYGVPSDILYSVMMTESNGNPNAHALTSKEDSRGLFQINVKAHPDVNSGMLFNPEYNATYIMPTLASAYNEGKSQGLTGSDLAVYVEKNGEKPAWNSTVESKVRNNYNDFVNSPTLTQIRNDYWNSTNPSGEIQNNGTANPQNGTSLNIWSGLQSSLSSVGSSILPYLKFSGVYLVTFVIFIFALYEIFINKGGKN